MDPDECFRLMLEAARKLLAAGDYPKGEDHAETLVEQTAALAGWRGFAPKNMKAGAVTERKLRALGPTADRLADRDWSASKHSAAVKMAAAVLELRKG